jgi:hypothetical protein
VSLWGERNVVFCTVRYSTWTHNGVRCVVAHVQMTRSEVEEEGGSVYAPTVQTARSVKEGKSTTVQ